jgi:hypothetical protein
VSNNTSLTKEISRVEFVSNIGNRPLRHGGMVVYFRYPPNHWLDASESVDRLLNPRGLVQGVDYHIPPWNTYGAAYRIEYRPVKTPLYVIFDNDMTFVMTKMGWDVDCQNPLDPK